MRLWTLASVLATLALGHAAGALEVVLQDGLDGYGGTDDCLLYAPSVVADVNYGASASFACGLNRWGERQVALIRFDLAEVPKARVTAACLELHANASTYPYRDIVVEAAPIAPANAGWSQGANDGERVPIAGTPCWNQLAYGKRGWAGSPGLCTPGTDYLTEPVATATMHKGSSEWVVFELSPGLVQRWLDEPQTNAGLRLCPTGERLEKGDIGAFDASEAGPDPALRPKLVLTLEDRPGLAEELERVRARRRLAELTAAADWYGDEVAGAGRPARARERLSQIRARVRACKRRLEAGEAPSEGIEQAAEFLRQARLALPADRAASYNETHRLKTDFALGTATSMEKVSRRDVPFAGPFAETLTIQAAGNEYEGAQVVVVPIDTELERVSWKVEPFSGAAAQIGISAAPVGYVKSDTPALTTPTNPSEWWPDPLLDFLEHFDCPAGEVQPIWVTVHVPAGTRAGTYATRLTVSARGAEPKTMRIRLRVFGFDVPKEQHLRTVWGTGEGTFARFYPNYDEQLAWRFFDLMLAHRMAPNDLYRTRPTGNPEEDGVYHLASVDALKRLREAGSAWWNIGYVLAPEHVQTGPDKAYKSYDDYLADCVRMFGPELERVRAAGWPEKSYGIYFLDETRDFEALAKAAKAMREHFPGVPLMTTGYDRSYGVDRNSPVADALDIWVPLTPRYHDDWERIREGRGLGKQAWWYICVGPRGRNDLNWFVEYPAIRARLLMGAATWHYQPDGFLYYRVAGWTYNERKITSGPMTSWLPRYHPRLPDGDGTIICAGPDGPLTTIRLENIRDGLEDYEYWWVLRDLVTRCEATGQAPPEKALLEVPEGLLKDIRTYSEDPAVLYKTRQQVAEAIEDLQHSLGGGQ
jgi:hypothetical protein